jgi:hypothetical protein
VAEPRAQQDGLLGRLLAGSVAGVLIVLFLVLLTPVEMFPAVAVGTVMGSITAVKGGLLTLLGLERRDDNEGVNT